MFEIESGSAASLRERQIALSRWDNEGGAGPTGPQGAVSTEAQSRILELTNAELVQLGSVHTVMQHYGHALRRGPAIKRRPGRAGKTRPRMQTLPGPVGHDPDNTER